MRLRASCGWLGATLLCTLLLGCPRAPADTPAPPSKDVVSQPEPAVKTATQAPALVARAHPWAVVLVRADDVLNQRSAPSADAALVQALAPDTRGIMASGATKTVGRAMWRQITHDGKQGWVNSAFLTEDVTAAEFEADSRVKAVIEDFATAIAARASIASMISARGLYVAHYDAPQWLAPTKAAGLFADRQPRSWRGPACDDACIEGTAFRVLGGTFLGAYNDPDRALKFGWWQTAGNASVLAPPSRLASFRYVTIYDPGDVADVPDWSAFTLFFEYSDHGPKIVGLAVNAWSP